MNWNKWFLVNLNMKIVPTVCVCVSECVFVSECVCVVPPQAFGLLWGTVQGVCFVALNDTLDTSSTVRVPTLSLVLSVR
jgi:hypothetical protein